MTTNKYILDANGEPVLENDLIRWAEWFEDGANRRVALTKVAPEIKVSTVFLGLDHNFSMAGPPVLWETMIFGGKHDQEMWRYRTRDEAIKGHENAVQMAKQGMKE